MPSTLAWKSGCGGWASKPSLWISISRPRCPVLAVVDWPPHSAILPACQEGPAGAPFHRANAAITAGSDVRPPMMISAPASSAAK